jgi:hypothetical protein
MDEPKVPPVLLDFCAPVKGLPADHQAMGGRRFLREQLGDQLPAWTDRAIRVQGISRLKEEQSALLGRDT